LEENAQALPGKTVFVAYGGSVAKQVGIAMCQCLENHGFRPLIQARRTRWWVGVNRQEEVFRIERKCNAVLAVNTDESYDEGREKFWDEVEKAKYGSPGISSVPLVGFVEEPGRILECLSVGSDNVSFRRDHHSEKCDEVIEALDRQISRTKGAQVTPEGTDLATESIT
jgi:hypothetical protein